MIQMILEKALSWNIFLSGKFIFLNIKTLFQEKMTLEEVARGDPTSKGAPDKYDLRKKL